MQNHYLTKSIIDIFCINFFFFFTNICHINLIKYLCVCIFWKKYLYSFYFLPLVKYFGRFNEIWMLIISFICYNKMTKKNCNLSFTFEFNDTIQSLLKLSGSFWIIHFHAANSQIWTNHVAFLSFFIGRKYTSCVSCVILLCFLHLTKWTVDWKRTSINNLFFPWDPQTQYFFLPKILKLQVNLLFEGLNIYIK